MDSDKSKTDCPISPGAEVSGDLEEWSRARKWARVARSELALITAVVVSLAVLVGALYVVLSGTYDQDTLRWAFGAISMILGYWLARGKLRELL